jgi:hypothetical protein
MDRRNRVAMLVALAIAVFASQALAATVVWTGTAGNGRLSDPRNWGGATPQPSDRLLIASTASVQVEVDLPNRVFAGLEFAGPGPVTLIGQPLTLTSDHPLNVNVAAKAPVNVTIATSLRFSARNAVLEVTSAAGGSTLLTFAAGHRLTFAGGNMQLWNNGPAAAYDIQADIHEESLANFELYGTNPYVLGGINRFTGIVTNYSDRVTIGRPEALGVGDSGLRMRGGELVLAPGTYTQQIGMG